MKRKQPEVTPQEFLAGYPPPIREISEALMQLVRDTVRGIDERVYPGWRLIGYRHHGYFCCVCPQEGRVRLGFERGIELPDPHGILEGDGTQMRWITVVDKAAIAKQKLRTMIELAARHDEERASAKPRRVPRKARRSTRTNP
jgi:hypothetical protein